MSWTRVVAVAVALALLAGVGYWALGGDSGSTATPPGGSPSATAPGTPATLGSAPAIASPGPATGPDYKGEYADAANLTREDSYYPDAGDPGVDSLHHDLTLDWDPDARTLTGTDDLTFRATADLDRFQLDLGEPLGIDEATLDGKPVQVRENGKDLIVRAAVEKDRVYVLHLAYSGTPEPVRAPTRRADLATLGFTIEPDGSAWTMQEPFGAFTWYPVNDQPADKAYYDFTITAPSPMVGVANGELTSRTEDGGRTTTTWHNDAPMSSYLTTIAIAPYEYAEDTTDSGTPITYWALPGGDAMERLRRGRQALEWVESKLGPYPFSTAGLVNVASDSAMETQTMLTIGSTPYALSEPVLVHEFVHQWYGDQVSPTDWRDVWMNEGMTMYLQTLYESENGGRSMAQAVDDHYDSDGFLREGSGPPAAYRPRSFGDGNIYYIPVVMWEELRERLGDEAFWSMVRAWPSVHAGSGATREQYVDWIEQTTGEELSDFFSAWLLGETTPARD